MIGFSYHPEAIQEIAEAARYYEERAPGLGKEFRAEVETAVDLLRRVPEAAPRIHGSLRRRPLKRFPHAILYAVEASEVRIYAVAHRRRRPDYFRNRLSI